MKDNIIFNSKFEFDKISNVFDDMVLRSIPDYNTMRYLTNSILYKYFSSYNKVSVYDLGCSTGLSSEYLIHNLCNGLFSLIDCSESMINLCKERFLQYNNINYIVNSIENEINNINNVDLFICSLTLHFIKEDNRLELIEKIYKKLNNNGIFILIEKTYPESLSNIFLSSYYDIKRKNGYTDEQIYSKKEALNGYLIPFSYKDNENLIRNGGFNHFECYWKCLNFAAWICIKV